MLRTELEFVYVTESVIYNVYINYTSRTIIFERKI